MSDQRAISIVDRLRFDATRCELQFSKGVAANISEAADEIASLRAQLTEWQDDYAALKARAKEVVAPFAMLADLDAKNMHGLESVYPMVAAGRLHDAKQFLSALTAEASHE